MILISVIFMFEILPMSLNYLLFLNLLHVPLVVLVHVEICSEAQFTV